MKRDIRHRCYAFSLAVIKFLRRNKWDQHSIILVKQLMRSATSVGANVIEARNSSTRVEFRRFYEIALKSCNETKYWICLLRDGFEKNGSDLKELLIEAKQLSNILGASIIKLRTTSIK